MSLEQVNIFFWDHNSPHENEINPRWEPFNRDLKDTFHHLL